LNHSGLNGNFVPVIKLPELLKSRPKSDHDWYLPPMSGRGVVIMVEFCTVERSSVNRETTCTYDSHPQSYQTEGKRFLL